MEHFIFQIMNYSVFKTINYLLDIHRKRMITVIIRHNTPTTATRTYMSTSGESSSTTKSRREEMSQIVTNL